MVVLLESRILYSFMKLSELGHCEKYMCNQYSSANKDGILETNL